MRANAPRRFVAAGIAAVVLAAALFQPLAHAQSKKDKGAKEGPAASPKSAKPKIVPGGDPGGVAVAIIGSGVNYTLPQIASRLARDGEGDLIGLDFVDRDNRPFDVAGPDTTPDGIRPMGTTLASVLLADAPRARLIPIRIQTGEPKAFGGAAAFIASTPARIAIVAHSSANRADWEVFEQAARTVAANVLFVVPAGDTGHDLDKQPHYPASLQLPNAIVVTAAAGGEGDTTAGNIGATIVDVEVTPATRIPALAIDGSAVSVGSSNYAAARVAALGTGILAAWPGLSAADLKARILAQATVADIKSQSRTRSGAIGYPAGGLPIAPRF